MKQNAVVHYYDVILGKCACGAAAEPNAKSYSVFPQFVSCPECLDALKKASGKTEGR